MNKLKHIKVETKDGLYDGFDRRKETDYMSINGWKISTQILIRGVYLLIIAGMIIGTWKIKVEANERRVDVVVSDLCSAVNRISSNETHISLLQKDVSYIAKSVDEMKEMQIETQKDIKKLLSRREM